MSARRPIVRSVCLAISAALAISLSGAHAFAANEERQTVESLLKADFEVKGVFPSPAGPGLVLEDDNRVFICFVTEAPQSEAIVTQYCKPVR